MVCADLVREIVARRERGESSRQIARELAVDRKTVRRWLLIGGWQPRQGGERPRAIDPYIEFIERRGPEVGWNGVVLHRELVVQGFSGSYQQVQRLLKPRRDRRRWQEAATVRFETETVEQCAGQAFGGEHAGPFIEGQIADDDDRAAFVALVSRKGRKRPACLPP